MQVLQERSRRTFVDSHSLVSYEHCVTTSTEDEDPVNLNVRSTLSTIFKVREHGHVWTELLSIHQQHTKSSSASAAL